MPFDLARQKTNNLSQTLNQYFGFESFRPLQKEIMVDSMAGRDVFVLLPTGGGKSLCYQLPALIRPGLTLVVSPLISLMKDQVDAMEAIGVAATFLNSSLDMDESRKRLRGLEKGEYRLLYVAPERLMLSGFLEDIRRWNVSLIAVDEAHCISEWGHDFRREYRRLAELREILPGVPFLALTATATERVREDIVRQLRLKNPSIYIASFNRPNLTYRVLPKHKPYNQVYEYIKNRSLESGIIYCQSRRTAESVAERLNDDGIRAKPYHAGLSADERNKNQDLFLRDEVRVICATIAFGMGINKPNVRFVIHYDLPKNIEGYYQETGRAGRDGLSGECLLLFGAGDTVKYAQFIDEKPDPKEQELARRQLQQVVQYAETTICRRVELLRYFGEELQLPPNCAADPSFGGNCAACDNCLTPRQTFDGTEFAHKFLSCVYHIRKKNGWGVGTNHVAQVLTGANTEKIRRWGHEELSTYGSGKDRSRQEWSVTGRELVRQGLLKQTTDKFSVLELTEEGHAVLVDRKPVTLSQQHTPPASSPSSVRESKPNELLFDRLRRLRKKLADERNVPAYIVFSDVTLRQMTRDLPSNEAEFRRISGVGDKKLQEYGAIFIAEIRASSV